MEVERSRHLTLRLNGSQVTAWTEGSVSTPWVFEVTGRMTGRDTLEMIADNSYPGWPHAVSYTHLYAVKRPGCNDESLWALCYICTGKGTVPYCYASQF